MSGPQSPAGRVFCTCGHEVQWHSRTDQPGRCLLQNGDGSECPCTKLRPETVHVGDTVYRLYPCGTSDSVSDSQIESHDVESMLEVDARADVGRNGSLAGSPASGRDVWQAARVRGSSDQREVQAPSGTRAVLVDADAVQGRPSKEVADPRSSDACTPGRACNPVENIACDAHVRRPNDAPPEVEPPRMADALAFRGKLQCILGLEGRPVTDDALLNAVRGLRTDYPTSPEEAFRAGWAAAFDAFCEKGKPDLVETAFEAWRRDTDSVQPEVKP